MRTKELASLAIRTLSCSVGERSGDSPAPIRAKLATETPVPEFDSSRGRIIPQVLLSDGFRVSGGSQVPLLDTHDRFSIESVLGSIRNLKTENGAVTGELHFSSGSGGQDARSKVEEGHVSDISVGFVTEKRHYIEPDASKRIGGRSFKAGKEGLNVATEWRAVEGSLTPIGADHAAKIMRAWKDQNSNNNTNQPSRMEVKEPETETRSADTVAEEARRMEAEAERANRAEKERVSEIRNMGTAYDIPEDDQNIAITGMVSIDAFRKQVNETLVARKKEQEREEAQRGFHSPLGLGKDIKDYSIFASCRSMAVGKNGQFGSAVLDGVAAEAHRALAPLFEKATGETVNPNALLVPAEFNPHSYARTMATTPDEDGGHLISTELRSLIEYCREELVMGRVGSTMLVGLQGNLKWPRRTNELTATWPGEQGATTPGSLTFGELTMSPNRVTAETDYTLMLLHQSSTSVEAENRKEIAMAISTAIDRGALYGDGSAGNPTGLMNTAGTQPLTFGTGAPTWQNVLKFDQLIEESNCPGSSNVNNASWLMSSNCKKVWLSTPKASGEGLGFLADPPVGNFNNPTANGARIIHHNNAGLGEKVIKGLWSNLYVGIWGALELVVDPYTSASNGRTRIVASAFADVGVRHAPPFVISTDNGDGSNA